jgi:NAD-dependent deacetylase
MRSPTVRDDLAVALDHVLVAEAGSLHVDAARVHAEPVVEARGLQVADVRLEDDGLDAEVAQLLVAARIALEVVDTRDLEPHEVVRVVGDALRVRLRETHLDVGCETEPVHEATMLAELIRANQPCVALTGAGVSTESGVPDFRSAGGIWERFDPYEVASIDAFHRDPARVWEFYALRLDVLRAAEPNAAHRALAALERAGLVEAVITQNVDRLHAAAGSQEVIEVHGTIAQARCLGCSAVVGSDDLELPLPHCPRCGAVLKPDVVMFGELLPAEAIDRATTLAQQAALLLVVGSSLEVWPVAGLPDETLSHGGEVAIVNRGPTLYDGVATLVVHASAGETLAEAARVLLRSGR